MTPHTPQPEIIDQVLDIVIRTAAGYLKERLALLGPGFQFT